MCVLIRKASIADVNEIVKIHCDAFNGFFLTSLGPEFLKFYYSCFIKSAEAVTITAEEDGKIIGFASNTKVCKGFNGRLINNNLFPFGLLTLRLLVSSPSSLVRLVKNLTKNGDYDEGNEDYAELCSLCVRSTAQGKGVGKMLLAYSELLMKEEGVTRLSLTTDYYNNESTVGFYHSMGYETLYEFFTYPNRRMYRLIKTL